MGGWFVPKIAWAKHVVIGYHTKPTNTLRAMTNQRAGNYKITPLLEQCWLQSTLWLVLVITCLRGQFGINYPNETRAI